MFEYINATLDLTLPFILYAQGTEPHTENSIVDELSQNEESDTEFLEQNAFDKKDNLDESQSNTSEEFEEFLKGKISNFLFLKIN